MVTAGLVFAGLGPGRDFKTSMVSEIFILVVGAPMSAIVGAVISVYLAYGILAEVSGFKWPMTGVLGGRIIANILASFLAVAGYFLLVYWIFFVLPPSDLDFLF